MPDTPTRGRWQDLQARVEISNIAVSAEATFGGLDAVASREVRGRNITVNAIAPIVNGVADRVRREMYRNIGLEDLLTPRVVAR